MAPDRLAMLVLGLFVIAGADCFIALRSRRMRMTAGALVVLAAAAGLVIALLADSPSLSPFLGLPCTNAPRPTCLQSVEESLCRVLGGLGNLGRWLWDRGPAPFGRGGHPDSRGRALTRRPVRRKPI